MMRILIFNTLFNNTFKETKQKSSNMSSFIKNINKELKVKKNNILKIFKYYLILIYTSLWGLGIGPNPQSPFYIII